MFEFFGAHVAALLHLLLVDDGEAFEVLGHLALLVHLDDLLHAVEGDGEEVVGVVLVGVPHEFLEDVDLVVYALALLGLEHGAGGGELLEFALVGLLLEVEAALEFAAHAGELLRVEGELLGAGSAGGDGLEVGEPLRAAELTAARADAA